jgi:rhodanese-related sulfurtransferase
MSVPHRGAGRITPDEARDLMKAAGTRTVLLDVRETPEWVAGHAPGAVHVPLSRLTEGAALPAGAQGRALMVICRSGNRSRQAAGLLCARGADAVDVVGGMTAWAGAGHAVVDEHGRPGSIT